MEKVIKKDNGTYTNVDLFQWRIEESLKERIGVIKHLLDVRLNAEKQAALNIIERCEMFLSNEMFDAALNHTELFFHVAIHGQLFAAFVLKRISKRIKEQKDYD